jgi:hypothetical protein
MPGVSDPAVGILLSCARVSLTRATTLQVQRLVENGVDWRRLLEVAGGRHGMRPLLYRHLNAVCPDAVPSSILESLRADATLNAVRNLVLRRALVRLLGLLEFHGIPAVPYKGPALAEHLYGLPGLRCISDLDVLVRRRDVARARALLAGDSRSIRQPDSADAAATVAASGPYYCTARMYEGGAEINVELHWRLPTTFGLEPDRLWERVRPAPRLGVTVLELPPEDLLLVLCAHGFKHYWHSLKWICDVRELIRTYPDLDWPALVRDADALRARRILLLGLRLAADLLDADLPGDVLRLARADRVVDAIESRVRRRLFDDAKRPVGPLDNLRIRQDWPSRGRYVLDAARYLVQPTTEDRNSIRLPAILGFLYPLVRMARLPSQRRRKYGTGPSGPPTPELRRVR